MIRATIECETAQELERWAVRYLESQGYHVAKKGPWERPNEFCKRLGIDIATLWRVRSRRGCPQIDTEEGNGKIRSPRLLRLRSTPEFEHFCTLFKNNPLS